MPAINPNDYNIDNFNSQNLGPITVSDFRQYVLNYNLPGVDPLVEENGYSDYGLNIYAPTLFNPTDNVQDIPDVSEVSFVPSIYNNNFSPRPNSIKKNIFTTEDPFYGSPKDEETFVVSTKDLQNTGSIDSWLNEGGFETDVFTIRNFIHLTNNEYGPSYVFDYSNPESFSDSTGYQQYPTSSGGDGSGIIGSIIGRTLGFSTTNFIDFPSELQDVAGDRRKTELENRIKLNFVEDTVGNINLDPLGLLGGQSLITPNYMITRPKGFLGKSAQFLSNIAGFEVPFSIIPGDDRSKISSNSFQEDLIDFTGKGQKDLLYFNVYSSKYSPELLTKGWNPDETTKDTILNRIGQFFDDLGKEEADTYLKISQTTTNENKTLSQKIGGFFNDLVTPNSNKSLEPTPERSTSPNDPFVTMGTEGQYPAIDGLDPNSTFVESDYVPPAYDSTPPNEYYPNKTTLQPGFVDDTTGQSPATKKNFDWRSRNTEVAKRGLLKFTQDMINKSEVNGHRGAARFIGRIDSDDNLTNVETEGGTRKRHADVSKANLVRNADNSHYCRSWSTRNPYQTHEDLIRADRLYRLRNEKNYLSVLDDNGHVKITPYVGDDNAKGSDAITRIETNLGNDVKRYMFSIENLAWVDADEKIGLKDCELGPNGGRIMWFPPYEINFTENTTASWETNNLLGRGEPIYTYNNTERKGTLSWAIVTDHPSSMKEMRDTSEKEIYQYFAGCGITEQRLKDIFGDKVMEQAEALKTEKEVEDKENAKTENEQAENNEENPLPIVEPQEPPVKNLKAYFRNARRDKSVGGVRSGVGRNIIEELDFGYALDGCSGDCIISSPATSAGESFTKNQTFTEDIDKLVDFLSTRNGQSWGIKIEGNTSGAANQKYNQVLSRDRAESVYEYIKQELNSFTPPTTTGTTGETKYITVDQQKFNVKRAGWVCIDNDQGLCKSETSKRVDGKLTYQQKLKYINPNDIEQNSRFIIIANSEDNSTSENDEDTIANNNDANNALAMEDRKVTITLFKNGPELVDVNSIKIDEDELIGEPPLLPDLDDENVQTPTLPFLSPFEQQFLNQNIEAQQQLNLIEDFQEFEGFAGKDLIDRQQVFTNSSKESTGTNEPIDDSPIGEDVDDNNVDDETLRNVIRIAVDELYTECEYFNKLQKSDPFIYETLKEKLKYFHPAFHSTTPEGLNSRLTFLNQCMRQGPNIQTPDTKTKNLAFGRPPVCVLRIGDFWYTKIVIDSFNVSYEPLVWDMNPEGIGVQPMIAKVDLNFSMIGGSSLDGPIQQLQNAVSYNYYANTSIYNSRRYYNNEDGTFKTLEERLSDLNEELLNNNEIGFGAFKSQKDALKEQERRIKNPQREIVETENDKKNQAEGIGVTETEPTKPLGPTPNDSTNNDSTPNDSTNNEPTPNDSTNNEPTQNDSTPVLISDKESEEIEKKYPKAETPNSNPKPKKVMDISDLQNIVFTNVLYKEGPDLSNNLKTLINGYVINKGGVDSLGKYLSEHEFEEFNMVIYILVSDVVGVGYNQWGSDLITRRKFGGDPRAKDLANAIAGQLTQTAKVNKGKIKISIELLSLTSESSKFTTPQKVSVKLKNGDTIDF